MRIFASLCAALVCAAALAAPVAVAAQTTAADTVGEESAVRLYVRIDGVLAPADPSAIESATSGLPSEQTPSGGPATPRLIDWNQWYGCFSLNNQDDIFAEYVHWWDGVGQDIRLTCGNGVAFGGWGYKHIRAKHEADWQAPFDQARAARWNPANDGMESWDDLMAFAAGQAVSWPAFKGGNSISGTTCGVTEVIFYEQNTGSEVYKFRARAGWADGSDRLITSFPQSGTTC
ncbi:hypothetical protein HQQ80_15755 [Microbacteriaceae bacterium VKM Ac-2855]|nr:hypothetical protein [Microbacteriaceae bacterium VKM Ac-2855]